MTTEDDFHALLDANPEDWHTRLVFSDWLRDRGDPRADGYQALGVLRRVPRYNFWTYLWDSGRLYDISSDPGILPRDWYEHVDPFTAEYHLRLPDELHLVCGENRRDGENKVALAFSRLPESRRHELLHPNGVPA